MRTSCLPHSICDERPVERMYACGSGCDYSLCIDCALNHVRDEREQRTNVMLLVNEARDVLQGLLTAFELPQSM